MISSFAKISKANYYLSKSQFPPYTLTYIYRNSKSENSTFSCVLSFIINNQLLRLNKIRLSMNTSIINTLMI